MDEIRCLGAEAAGTATLDISDPVMCDLGQPAVEVGGFKHNGQKGQCLSALISRNQRLIIRGISIP
jgi:hypothetical protein